MYGSLAPGTLVISSLLHEWNSTNKKRGTFWEVGSTCASLCDELKCLPDRNKNNKPVFEDAWKHFQKVINKNDLFIYYLRHFAQVYEELLCL